MLRKIVATSYSWLPLPLRLALGAIFIGHGAQKVLGKFSGPGLERFTSLPAPFSFMRPAWLWMGMAAIAELIGGVLVLLGLFTRVGAFLIACVMLTAVIGVHWSKGFFGPGGYEFPMSLFAVSLALIISGGGAASVDRVISGRRR